MRAGSLYLKQQSDSSEGPFGRFLFGLQVEGPDVRGSTLSGLIDGTLVQTAGLLFVHRNGFDENHRHCGRELL